MSKWWVLRFFRDQTEIWSPDLIWRETAIAADCGDILDRDISCDVAIIGAGFTGLSAALHLAEAGKSVSVLERNHIGFGGSGRNTGMVNAGIWLDPNQVVSTIGATAGMRLNQALAMANVTVFDLIKRHGLSCNAVQSASIQLAYAARDESGLRDRCSQMSALGGKTRFVDPAEAAALTGAKGYHGGLVDENAGTINPLSYARGLARTARLAGARIFEHHTALMPVRSGGCWHVPVGDHRVLASFVLVATNAYSTALAPELAGLTIPMPFIHIATDPLGPLADTLLFNQICAWDTRSTVCCFRKDPKGRLILGTLGSTSLGRLGLVRRWARAQVKSHFPQVAGVPIRNAWIGRIGFTPMHTPQYVELAKNMIAPVAYNGRGIGPGTVFGKNLADFVISDFDPKTLFLPTVPPKRILFRKLRAKSIDSAATGLRLIGWR